MQFRSQADLTGSVDGEKEPVLRTLLEVSLKLWHKDWMKLSSMRAGELNKFSDFICVIQKQGLSAAKNQFRGQKIDPKTSSQIKKIYPICCADCYEFRLGRKARVFVGFDKKVFHRIYLLYIDPNHRVFPHQ